MAHPLQEIVNFEGTDFGLLLMILDTSLSSSELTELAQKAKDKTLASDEAAKIAASLEKLALYRLLIEKQIADISANAPAEENQAKAA